MHTNIRKWGNSAGTIIPAAILQEAGLEIGDALDAFMGSWSSDECDEFDEAIKTFEQTDDELWP